MNPRTARDETRARTDDVMSMLGIADLADIVLCPTVAAKQAEAAGHPADVELALLLTRGVLHLLGHDHAEPEEHERMFALQAELLQDWLAVPR